MTTDDEEMRMRHGMRMDWQTSWVWADVDMYNAKVTELNAASRAYRESAERWWQLAEAFRTWVREQDGVWARHFVLARR